MKYTLQILDDKEFERLPYPDMATSLGVADPKKNAAYVRRTGFKPMDAYNAMHELEHLSEKGDGKYAHHYRNGVYYKGFGDVMGMIVPALGTIFGGPVGGAAGAALMGGTKNLGLDTQAPKVQQPTQQSVNPAGMGSQPQQVSTPQVQAPNVSQGGSQGTDNQLQTGSAMNMDKLRQMLSGSEAGRDPSATMSQFGMNFGTGRMA